MKRIEVIYFSILCFVSAAIATLNIQAQTIVQVDNHDVYLNFESGLLTGDYASFYPNGNRKVEGQFEYNRRVGQWKFYNEAGDLTIVRNHTAPLCVTQETPAMETQCGTAEFESLQYKKLQEGDVKGLVR